MVICIPVVTELYLKKNKWKYGFPATINQFNFPVDKWGNPMSTAGQRNIGHNSWHFGDVNDTPPGKATQESIYILVWPGVHNTGLTSRRKK